MQEKRSSEFEQRVWALRDRSRSPPNRIRARAMRLSPTEAERKLMVASCVIGSRKLGRIFVGKSGSVALSSTSPIIS